MRGMISKALCFAISMVLMTSFIGEALAQAGNVRPPQSIVKEALRLQQQKGDKDPSETPWKQDLKLQRFLNYYYTKKPAFQTPIMVQRLIELGYMDQLPVQQNYVIGFLAVVFHDNKDVLKSWLDQLDATQYQAGAIVRAARHAGAIDIIKQWTEEQGWTYTEEDAFDPLPMPLEEEIVTPEDVERFWGAYIADGREAYLSKLFDTMLVTDVQLNQEEINKGNYETFKKRSVNEVIEGVLINAGIQYEHVKDYLLNLASKNQNAAQNQQLQRIIANVYATRNSLDSQKRAIQ